MTLRVRNLSSMFNRTIVIPGDGASAIRAQVRAWQPGLCFTCGTHLPDPTFTIVGGLVPGTVLAAHDDGLYPARPADEPVGVLAEWVGGPLDQVHALSGPGTLVVTGGRVDLLAPAFDRPVPAMIGDGQGVRLKKGQPIHVGEDSRLSLAGQRQVGVVAEDAESSVRLVVELEIGR